MIGRRRGSQYNYEWYNILLKLRRKIFLTLGNQLQLKKITLTFDVQMIRI